MYLASAVMNHIHSKYRFKLATDCAWQLHPNHGCGGIPIFVALVSSEAIHHRREGKQLSLGFLLCLKHHEIWAVYRYIITEKPLNG